MKLSEFTSKLNSVPEVKFRLPDGQPVPSHFHVTEIGKIDKHFIDCGGKMRSETVINFQLFTASDYDHRLSTTKLQKIIALSVNKLNLPDASIEVEYQAETIGKYGVESSEDGFILTNKFTDCLAKDSCGIPQTKQKIKLANLNDQTCCAPDSNCC